MAYTVTGTLHAGRDATPFERTVAAESAAHARETVLSQLGSEHGLARANIDIDTVSGDGDG